MQKIKIQRKWGKDFGSDIMKMNILGFGGMELIERKVTEKVFGKKKVDKVPLSPDGKATKEYMTWVGKRKKFKELWE